MNKIDNFFKEKLSDHSIPPRDGAWARVESGLSKKNNKTIWLRIAAVLLICGAGISLWVVTQKSQVGQHQLANNEALSIPEAVEEKITAEKQVDASEQNANQITTAEINKNTTVIKKEKKIPNRMALTVTSSEGEGESEIIIVKKETATLIAQEEAVIKTLTPINELESSMEKPMVIEYTLATVNAPANEVENEAIARKTGLKKVLEIAGEVRSGEGGLGGLRQAKNEIFAFNFIKDKEEKTNK